jgi:excisionase family DNA binding protein
MEASAQTTFAKVSEAGQILGVSESTVWRMIRKGVLPSVRKGGRRLIPRAALESHSIRRQQDEVPPLAKDHPIFRLVGAGRSGGIEPGARDKHAILDQ